MSFAWLEGDVEAIRGWMVFFFILLATAKKRWR